MTGEDLQINTLFFVSATLVRLSSVIRAGYKLCYIHGTESNSKFRKYYLPFGNSTETHGMRIKGAPVRVRYKLKVMHRQRAVTF
jgi:hypothetical protein